MGSELFIYGNPRLLSGGAGGKAAASYDCAPRVVCGRRIDTAYVESRSSTNLTGIDGLESVRLTAGQAIHGGKLSYHHRPELNTFLVDGQWPSAGIELETEERSGVDVRELEASLRSNWFHFESDSSLSVGDKRGYELITEPLPPRAYRDPRLWAGLQNILTPWVESFSYGQTGLHVHVGLNQFEGCGELPLRSPSDRRRLGKYASAFIYMSVLDRTFTDRVMLRKPGGYCMTPPTNEFGPLRAELATGRMTGADLYGGLVEILVSPMAYRSKMQETVDAVRQHAGDADLWTVNETVLRKLSCSNWITSELDNFTGHGTEVNCSHSYTVEFRRGKGTLHSLSIHRMVELTTMIVRYAWKLAREPGTVVTPSGAYDFIINNTTNPALRKMAEKARG